MSYTQQQAEMLLDVHCEDGSILNDLSDHMLCDWEGFQITYPTLYDIVSAMELVDDTDAWNWVQTELIEEA